MENLNKIDKSFCVSKSTEETKLNHELIFCDSSLLGRHESSKLFKESNFTDKEKSILYSHYQIWKKLCTSKRDQFYFVFEGKSKTNDSFLTIWNNFLSKKFPSDFALCMVGDYQMKNIPKEDYYLENNYFCRLNNKTPSFKIQSSCYIISKSAANLIVQFIQTNGFSSDLNLLFNFFISNPFFKKPQSIVFLKNPQRKETFHSGQFLYNTNDLLNRRTLLIDTKKDFETLLKEDYFKKWITFKKLPTIKEYPKPPTDNFSCYNPDQRIAMVTLYNKETASYGYQCELNLKNYCFKNNYTLYVYRDSIDKSSFASWSKPEALLNHIRNHDIISWIDSDTLIFNPDKKIEWIVDNTTQYKEFLFSKDIGGHNYINSGVFFCRNKPHTIKLLKKWKDSKSKIDTSSLFSSGGDQKILGDIVKNSDIFKYHHKIFPMSSFNTDPRFVNWDTFIIHFMSYPKHLKDYLMNYWNFKFPIYK